jgi:hypothetical protein
VFSSHLGAYPVSWPCVLFKHSAVTREETEWHIERKHVDLLETWLILEFCDHGSLDMAIRCGNFRHDMVSSTCTGLCKVVFYFTVMMSLTIRAVETDKCCMVARRAECCA